MQRRFFFCAFIANISKTFRNNASAFNLNILPFITLQICFRLCSQLGDSPRVSVTNHPEYKSYWVNGTCSQLNEFRADRITCQLKKVHTAARVTDKRNKTPIRHWKGWEWTCGIRTTIAMRLLQELRIASVGLESRDHIDWKLKRDLFYHRKYRIYLVYEPSRV